MAEGIDRKRISVFLLLFANAGLFILKASIGYLFNSMAVLADAYNSFFDTLFSIVLLIGIHYSTKPPDPSHPLGHSRIKPIIGLFVAFAIFFGAIQIVSEAINRLMHGIYGRFNILMIVALMVSIATKSGMFYFLKKVGKHEKSPPIKAAATDSRMDIFASTIAIVGILGARWLWLCDPLMGLAISAWIFKTGIETAQENVDYLIGKAPPPSLEAEIEQTIRRFEQVRDVHDMIAYYSGLHVHVRVHIAVADNLSLRNAHKLEEKVEEAILKLKSVNRVFIHIDPVQVE